MAGEKNILDEEKLKQALAIAASLKEMGLADESSDVPEKPIAVTDDRAKDVIPDDEPAPYVISDIVRRRKKHGHPVWRILFVIFLALFAIGAFFVIRYVMQDMKNRNNMDELRDTTEQAYEYDEDMAGNIEDSETTYIPIDFEEIQESAEDVIAWIYVPGTDIDYPVVKHPEDDEYYLSHDIYGESNVDGAIFIQSVNSSSFDDFDTIVYGHNMRNGSMFRSLHNYEDEDFCRDNRYVYIYTPDSVYTYKIFAAYVYDDTYIPEAYDFDDETGRQSFLDDIKTWAVDGTYFDDVEVDTDSRVITLSTCTGDDDERFLVQAVLISE